MRRSKSTLVLPSRWRWLVPSILTGGGVGYGIVLVQEEAQLIECLPLAALSGLAGAIYLLDHIMFKARLPRREDTQHKPPYSERSDTTKTL